MRDRRARRSLTHFPLPALPLKDAKRANASAPARCGPVPRIRGLSVVNGDNRDVVVKSALRCCGWHSTTGVGADPIFLYGCRIGQAAVGPIWVFASIILHRRLSESPQQCRLHTEAETVIKRHSKIRAQIRTGGGS